MQVIFELAASAVEYLRAVQFRQSTETFEPLLLFHFPAAQE